MNVVCFGGGTGLSTLLSRLKWYVAQPANAGLSAPALIERLTAVVAVSDNGGSSGRLREDFHVLPPGDIRNCLVALAEDEALLARMFRFRFQNGAGLEGHSFGNLFLTVLTALHQDFPEAVKVACAMLKTRGRVLPATDRLVDLVAELKDGSLAVGEISIAAAHCGIRRLHMAPADAAALPETLEAIAEADLITIGPGSLYTSLIPNLLVKGIPEAIAESRALKVYICNLMTQPNESLGMTAADHVRAIYKHAGRRLFDYALINRQPFRAEMLRHYAESGATPVVCDREQMQAMGLAVIEGNYVAVGDVARHAADAVARDVLPLALEKMAERATAMPLSIP